MKRNWIKLAAMANLCNALVLWSAAPAVGNDSVGRSARELLTADPIIQQAYLKASNADAYDEFSWSVAVSGDTLVVGAAGESSGATGVNGDQSDNSALGAGAAYVFVRRGTTWTQQAYLKASNTAEQDGFGASVAVSGDTVVVGAPNESSMVLGGGAVYVFVRNGTTWTQQAYLIASNPGSDGFGYSVAVDGDTVVVGAEEEASNATGVNGSQTDNSALMSGAAYVFVRNGATWVQQAYLKASNTGAGDQFGTSVAVSGDTVVVGAPFEGSSATGVNGNQNDNSASEAGAAYVFVSNGATWSQQAYLKASNTEGDAHFGLSVAVSDDTVVVGANRERSNATGVNGDQANHSATQAGAAYVFVRSAMTWSQQAYLKASNTTAYNNFGWFVAASGDTVVVGAPDEGSSATGVNGDQTNGRILGAGAAYVFVRDRASWGQQAYLKASNTDPGDQFGLRVGVSGDTVVVGTPYESSNATGVNGDQNDNSATFSGAAYVFAGLGTTGCFGDCDGNGSVTVGELLTIVNIALGNADVSSCNPGDANHDGQITVDEILAAVNNALNGCTEGLPSATPTKSGTPHSTVTPTATVVLPASVTPTSTKTKAATSTPLASATPTLGMTQFVDNGDGTITDHNSNLVWEKKDQGGGLHDLHNTYVWAGLCLGDTTTLCQSSPNAASACAAATGGALGCAQCGPGLGTCDTFGESTIWDWLVELNASSFAGHSDWRIPGVGQDGGTAELETILAAQYLHCTSSPCVPPVFNAGCTAGCMVTTCSCTVPSSPAFYWSATTQSSAPTFAWLIDFSDAFEFGVSKIADGGVRAVRGP